LRRVQLKIEDVAFGGKGVARDHGKAVFVPYTIDGESVSAEVVREKKKFAEAEVLDVLEPSAHRVAPQCPYFGRCGGCSYQHIDYEHQLAIKWRQVRDVLQRIGKLKDIPMRPIISSSASYAYRNRITVHVEEGVIGFFRRDSHRLIDVERCPIAMESVNHALTALRASRPREGHYTLRSDPSGPRIFAQANDIVATALRDFVSGLIPTGQQLLIDAYCGAGFFAKTLRRKFARVIGIDWDRFAIQEAEKNATDGETYIAGDVDLILSDLQTGAIDLNCPQAVGSTAPAFPNGGGQTTLIADPPATGLGEITRRTIMDIAPETFVYVSCNPATLARDLQEFTAAFTIESVTPLDMFPQTAEVEVVVHLQAQTRRLRR
jgi:tRNA/tmRNA/rRNA uracil-C5-methylase (TrmA/RlmC/RlmD family)